MTILAALDPCVCRSAEGERNAPDCAADNRGDRSDSLCPAARREGPALRRRCGSPRSPGKPQCLVGWRRVTGLRSSACARRSGATQVPGFPSCLAVLAQSVTVASRLPKRSDWAPPGQAPPPPEVDSAPGDYPLQLRDTSIKA